MMNNKFDKLLKSQMQEDDYIPEKINQLFSNFESEVSMKEEQDKKNVFKFSNYLGKISIAACTLLVTFVGGCTYAHINGRENIMSPLLRNLGINSKYEENAKQFNSEVVKKDVKVKMLDGALDDTTLILGYEIEILNNKPDVWIEINGEYKINDVSVKPINTNIDRLSDTSYIYYQIFDANEVKIKDNENVKINVNIYEIKEYTENESYDSVYAVYGDSYIDGWNFSETINLKNLEKSKEYEFKDAKQYQIAENVNISVTEFITGSYANILKIKTDKTNYKGNNFEKFYKILDEQNKDIAMFVEEEKQYDQRVYTDRFISSKLDKNSKIIIEVYFKKIEEEKFKKVATIPVDLSKATEKVKNTAKLKQYKNNDYSIEYYDNWNLITNVDTSRVGSNSIYLGALQLEIPSTTNSKYTSSIYVKVINQDTTIEEYAKQVRVSNTASPSEYFKERNSSESNFKNAKGYQITSETTDGEEVYIKQDVFTVMNGKVYRIIFFGSEKEYNNLKEDWYNFISNFEILNNNSINNKDVSSSKTEQKEDYSKYFGKWFDEDGESQFSVDNIGNNLITFSWGIYRTLVIDYVTVPIKDNEAVFYYQGYEDKNYNNKNDNDEHYCRKATIKLGENKIIVNIEDCDGEELSKNIQQDISYLMGGSSAYIPRGDIVYYKN